MSENHEEKNNDTNQKYCIDCATIKNIYTHHDELYSHFVISALFPENKTSEYHKQLTFM